MKEMRRTRISMALAAALAGVGVSSQALAVNISTDNLGDLGVVPYYTVRDGWVTDFNIINTSSSVIAAKIRFHEARNSRDVLDFQVVLSPYDQFIGWVRDTESGPVLEIAPQDDTCVAPEPNVRVGANGPVRWYPFSNEGYAPPNSDGFEQDLPGPDDNRNELTDIDRAREGYFTVIEMGAAMPGWEKDQDRRVPYYASHPTQDCAEVAKDLTNPQTVIEDTYYDFVRNLNALKINFSISNSGNSATNGGVQGAQEAEMFANFATDSADLAHTAISVAAGSQLANSLESQVKAKQAEIKGIENQVTALYNTISVACKTPGAEPNGNYTDPYTSDPAVSKARTGCNATDDALIDQITPLVAQRSTALVELNTLLTQWVEALEDAFGPPRNILSAQYDDEYQGNLFMQYPNLDSGSRAMTLTVDGIYNYDEMFTYVEDGGPDTGATGTYSWPYAGWYEGHFLRGVDALTALLMHSSVVNEWAQHAANQAYTDWILTAPTKSFYVDLDYVYKSAVLDHGELITGLANNLVPVLNLAVLPPFGSAFDGRNGSCDPVNYRVFNLNEVGADRYGDLSPWAPSALCWETNVLYMGEESMLGSALAEKVDVAGYLGNLGVEEPQRRNGWLDIDLATWTRNYHPAIPGSFGVPLSVPVAEVCVPNGQQDGVPPSYPPNNLGQCRDGDALQPVVADAGFLLNYQEFTAQPFVIYDSNGDAVDVEHGHELWPGNEEEQLYWVQTGMPYIGYAFKDRTLGGTNQAFGGLFEHGYRRGFEGRNGLGGTWPFPF